MAVPKGQIQTWVRWQAVLHHYGNTCYYRFRLPVNLAQRGASGPQKTFVPTKFLISIPVGIMDRGKRGERGKKLARFRESSQITQTVFFFFPRRSLSCSSKHNFWHDCRKFLHIATPEVSKTYSPKGTGNHRCTYVEHCVLKSTLTSLLRPVIQIMVGSRCFPSCQLVGMSPSPDIVQLHLTGPHNHRIKLSSNQPFNPKIKFSTYKTVQPDTLPLHFLWKSNEYESTPLSFFYVHNLANQCF